MSVDVRAFPRLDDEQRRSLARLVEAATAHDGVPPVSEETLLDARAASPRGVFVLADDGRAGVAHVQDGSAELVVAPAQRRRGVGTALLAAVERIAAEPRMWAHGSGAAARGFAESAGYRAERILWLMRRADLEGLPAAPLPSGFTLRCFVPGQDDDAWLAVNARAFSEHPEQGRWTRSDLRARLAEPWFDAAGFFLAVATDSSDVAGFHWTKVDNGEGEIYVLGVDPAYQGRRLATPLAVAGLNYLRERGVDGAMLYVDDSNSAAVRLYERLGFHRARADVQFTSAAPTAPARPDGGRR